MAGTDDEDEHKDDMKETDPNFYKAIGKRRKNSPPIDFSDWNLFDEDELASFFKSLLKKGFEHATENYNCYAWFIGESDENFEADAPTDIIVSLPIGETDGDSPEWTFSLTEMIKDMIEMNECGPTGKSGPIDEDAKPQLTAIRDDLRRLANLIDMALARKPKLAPKLKVVKPELKS